MDSRPGVPLGRTLAGKRRSVQADFLAADAKMGNQEDDLLSDVGQFYLDYLANHNQRMKFESKKRFFLVRTMGIIMLTSFLTPFIDQFNDRLDQANSVIAAPLPDVKKLQSTVQQLEAEIESHRRLLGELQHADVADSVSELKSALESQLFENTNAQFQLERRTLAHNSNLKATQDEMGFSSREIVNEMSKSGSASNEHREYGNHDNDSIYSLFLELERERLHRRKVLIANQRVEFKKLSEKAHSDAASSKQNYEEKLREFHRLTTELDGRRAHQQTLAELQENEFKLRIESDRCDDEKRELRLSLRQQARQQESIQQLRKRTDAKGQSVQALRDAVAQKSADIQRRRDRLLRNSRRAAEYNQKLRAFRVKLAAKDAILKGAERRVEDAIINSQQPKHILSPNPQSWLQSNENQPRN